MWLSPFSSWVLTLPPVKASMTLDSPTSAAQPTGSMPQLCPLLLAAHCLCHHCFPHISSPAHCWNTREAASHLSKRAKHPACTSRGGGLCPVQQTSYANEGLCLHQSQHCSLRASHSSASIGPACRGLVFSLRGGGKQRYLQGHLGFTGACDSRGLT